MIDSKTLTSLDSITKYKTYSRCYNILNKRFKGNSLRSLVKTFKHPRLFVKAKFLEEFAKKYPHENDQFIDTNAINKSKRFLESLKVRKPKRENVVQGSWGRKPYKISSYKMFEPEPDPFRYHPNYQSIYKNIPCCIISPPKYETINTDKIVKKFQLNKKIKKHNKNNNSNKSKSLDKSNSSNKVNDIKTIEVSKEVKSNDLIKSEIRSKTLPAVSTHRNFLKNTKKKVDKNNHAFKFEDYMPRKEKIVEHSEIVSYLEPINYKKTMKKTIDFGRMKDREKSVLINYANLDVPCSSYYSLKYEITEVSPKHVLFTRQDIIEKNKKNKKFLIHKLWTSYNICERYQLVDNDKLDNSKYETIQNK